MKRERKKTGTAPERSFVYHIVNKRIDKYEYRRHNVSGGP